MSEPTLEQLIALLQEGAADLEWEVTWRGADRSEMSGSGTNLREILTTMIVQRERFRSATAMQWDVSEQEPLPRGQLIDVQRTRGTAAR